MFIAQAHSARTDAAAAPAPPNGTGVQSGKRKGAARGNAAAPESGKRKRLCTAANRQGGAARAPHRTWDQTAPTEIKAAHEQMAHLQSMRVAAHEKVQRAAGVAPVQHEPRADRDDWQVRPDKFLEYEQMSVEDGGGMFEVDACAAPDGSNAMTDVWWHVGDDCRRHDWAGKNVWANIPYQPEPQSTLMGEILQHFLKCWERSPYTTSATFVLPAWEDQTWFALVRDHFVLVERVPKGTMFFSRPAETPRGRRLYVGPTRWDVVVVRKARLQRPVSEGIAWGAQPSLAPTGQALLLGGDSAELECEGEACGTGLWQVGAGDVIATADEVARAEARTGARGAPTAARHGDGRATELVMHTAVPDGTPSAEEQRRAIRACLRDAGDPAARAKDMPTASREDFEQHIDQLLLDEQHSYVAGRPRWHTHAWEESLLGDETAGELSKKERQRARMVVRWMRDGYKLEFKDASAAPREKRDKARAMLRQQGVRGAAAEAALSGMQPAPMEFRNLRSALEHSTFMDQKVRENLRLGILRRWSQPGKPLVVSPMGVVEGAKLREIMHGSYVSLWLDNPAFTYETVKVPMQFIRLGDHLFTVDAKSGYYHIPVHVDSQPYLGVQWRGKYYVYTVLPMGIGPACYVYTLIMAMALRPLRRRGWRLSSYIDDSIYAAASKAEALGMVEVVVRYMAALGIYLSRKKCVFWPAQRATHLGKVLDTTCLRVMVPQEKVDTFVEQVHDLLDRPRFTLRHLARVCGKLISFMPAVTAAPLFVRTLYGCARGAAWDDDMVPQALLLDNLRWLAASIGSINGATWAPPAVAMTVKVDAGESGFGLTVESGPHAGLHMVGALPLEVLGASSTHREVAAYTSAILELLRQFGSALRGRRVMLVGDSQSAVKDINKMGAVGHPQITDYIRRLWLACHIAGVSLSATWRPRELLQWADELSKAPDAADWSLTFERAAALWRGMGMPELDAFADDANNIFAQSARLGGPLAQPGAFFSAAWAPGTAGVNGLAQDWAAYGLVWVFPPVPLAGQALCKVLHDRVDAICILPVREDKWWWSLLAQLPVAQAEDLPGQGLFTMGRRAGKTPEHARPYKNRWRALHIKWPRAE